MRLRLTAVLLLLACSSTPSPTRCTAGQVSACPCPGGGAGSQACGPDGVFGVCSCTSADAGSDVALDVPAQPEAATDARADGGLEDLAEVSSVDAQDVQSAEVGSDTPSAPEASMCPAGFGDCDAVASNGCETNILEDWGNCGACGRVCPNPSSATPFCRGGVCGFTCGLTRGDCDGDIANGCETRTDNNPRHCGACRNDCGARSCVSGRCT